MNTAAATTSIRNELGLHARPATMFCETASRFSSEITVTRIDGGGTAAVTSIFALLTLALPCGAGIEIIASGPDAAEAVEELVRLVESCFGEERVT